MDDLGRAAPHVESLHAGWRGEAHTSAAAAIGAAIRALGGAAGAVASAEGDFELARAAASAAARLAFCAAALAARADLRASAALRAAETKAIGTAADAHALAAELAAAQLEAVCLPAFDAVNWGYFRAASSDVELTAAAVSAVVALQGAYYDLVLRSSRARAINPSDDNALPALVACGDGRSLFAHAAGSVLVALAGRYEAVSPSFALLPTLCADVAAVAAAAGSAAHALGRWRGAVGEAWRAAVARAHLLSCPLDALLKRFDGSGGDTHEPEGDAWAWCEALAAPAMSAVSVPRLRGVGAQSRLDVLRCAAAVDARGDEVDVMRHLGTPRGRAWTATCTRAVAAGGGVSELAAEARSALVTRLDACDWDISTGGIAHWRGELDADQARRTLAQACVEAPIEDMTM